MTLLDVFEAQAKRTPTATAVTVEDGKSYSYKELDLIALHLGTELACAIAVAAVEEGQNETPLVAIMMTRGIALVAGILGILKAGAAYVPVDPSFPPDRQSHIFSHCKCQLLITDRESLKLALSIGVIIPPTLVVNDIFRENSYDLSKLIFERINIATSNHVFKEKTRIDGRKRATLLDGGGLAYVLYTSGSTGKPKGVMVKHDGVFNCVNWFAEQLEIGPHSAILGLSTICFDISVLEMFLPLIRGGVLVMVNQSSQKDPFRLLDIIKETKVTVMQATPTTYEMLFATGWSGDRTIDFLVGGEAFRTSLVQLAGMCKSLRNIYGPTETSIWTTSYTLPSDPKLLMMHNGVPVIPVGMPVDNAILYIVAVVADETLPKKLAAVGEEGELWIGGVGVSKGYINAPDLTAKVFLKNPFDDGAVYRTGDLVKRVNGGTGDYLFIRRIDDQVKIDGFRIELAEIEIVFMACENVSKAVAVVRNNKLALYVRHTDNEKGHFDKKHFQQMMVVAGRSLTYYMMPKHIVQVAAFPVSVNGKTDRNALPDPLESDRCSASEPTEADPADDDDNDCEGSEYDRNEDEAKREAPSKKMLQSDMRGVIFDEHKEAKMAMAKHVIDMVEKLRGRRPLLSNSFASIGVDSLGAVMFIKYLSDSLGGLRLEPGKIYAPGVTIRSFAADLYVRLSLEKPEVLIQLGIYTNSQSISNKDYKSTLYGEDDEEEEMYKGYKDVQQMESSFEDLLSTNRALTEGLRGVFTFFVLYDHFHHPHSAINQAFTADTYLFIMLSGFTTSLQLREPPVFLKTLIAPSESDETANTPRVSGTVAVPVEQVEAGDRYVKYVLQPRQRLNVSKFIIARFVGLLPIMWLGLLINVPSWMNENNSRQPATTQVVCSALYIVAMQSWWRPQCGQYGPNNLLYASILINCFLIYVVLRLMLTSTQNYLMKWASNDLSPITLLPPAESIKNRTWKQWVGDTMVVMSFNRTNLRMMFIMTAIFFCIGEGLFGVMYFNTVAKNALTFMPYFVVGNMAASVLESIHVAMWDWRRKASIAQRNGEKISPTMQFIYDVLHHSSMKATRPWVHDSNLFSYFYRSQISPVKDLERRVANDLKSPNSLAKQDEVNYPLEVPAHRGFFFLFCYQLWRFLPDLMSISIGFLMSTLGSLYDPAVGSTLWFVIIPTVFLAFFIVNMLQKGSARYNMSRFFLECAPISTMGYASYAIYLFQRQAFSFYASYFYFGVKNHRLDRTIGDKKKWFERLNGGYKLIAVVVLTIICWLVHKYYQDGFITHLYAKFLQRRRRV